MEKKAFQIADAAEVKVGRCLAVKKVLKTDTALYFTDKAGLAWRLSNHGTFGWRLQINAEGYGAFCDMGAAQALAKYMKEELRDAALPINVVEEDGVLAIKAADGTSATLALAKTFALKLISAKGNAIHTLKGAAVNGAKLVLTGALAEDEAIYGGGERFDVVNKRGTVMDLYSCDGWNNSGTTYVVQPFFLTTNGGGVLFNRYESAVADFGKEKADEWVYSVRSPILDAYFYPTDDLAGALQALTDLTGHALMPTPWMQGMQICRYAPDYCDFDKGRKFDDLSTVAEYEQLAVPAGDGYVLLSTLDDAAKAKERRFFLYNEEAGRYDLKYVKDDCGRYGPRGPKGNPGGDSCKAIMENHMKNDMKPAAASMEARGWERGFDGTAESLANKEDLIKSIEWLHANDLRAMVYIGVGNVRPQHVGFKEEYLVHADVEITNPDGSKTLQENTTRIPFIVGTGENPDVGVGKNGYRTQSYLDITNEEAVQWSFGQIWGEVVDIGMDGVKIDFCEEMPDEGRQTGIVKTHYRWKNPDLMPDAVHHAYPTFYISAFTKMMNERKLANGKTDGFMVFSRGGGIGSQRNPYMWAGDQGRQFEKLDDQVMGTVNSGLSGIPYMSYDMAGYDYAGPGYFFIPLEKESEIFIRATEFTAFMTNMQTHGDVRHAYEMTEEVQGYYRNYLKLHSELIPYMQKYSRIACDTGMPPVRHPVLKYPADKNVYSMTDEFFLGDAILVAPILTEQTFEREVYLPAGSWTNLLTDEVVEGGKTITVKASLGQIPVFLDNNSPDAAELAPIFAGKNWTAIKSCG